MNEHCLSYDWQPIVAQCTPQGVGAIAMLRLSGKNVRNLIEPCISLSSKKLITEVATHTINHGYIYEVDGKTLIDEVLFLVMDGPRSFTGEDSIEITSHNNQFIVQAIIARLCALGARVADRGEFTRRAYQNKKIDLLQAEAIADIIHANNENTLKASLAQLQGSLSQFMYILEHEVYRIAAWCQASFEFLDDEGDFKKQMYAMTSAVLQQISSVASMYSHHKHIREGIRIAVIGAVNAGKSSLFNCLIDKNRSIVTDIPGTTRDTVEACVYRNGNHWTIVDTAGIRITCDVIEQEGVRRSYEEAEKADIIVLVYDGSRNMSESEVAVYDCIKEQHGGKTIFVVNKADQPCLLNDSVEIGYLVSSKDKTGIAGLLCALDDHVKKVAGEASPFLLNARHHQLLESIREKLVHILAMVAGSMVHYELVLIHLHDALALLSSVTGKTVSEKSMDMVFKEFCVGK